MATLVSTGSQFARFNPISSTLNNLQAGAGTIAALCRIDSIVGQLDCCGLVTPFAPPLSNWYHYLHFGLSSTSVGDDDGLVTFTETPTWAGASNTWYILVATWAAGTVTERFHHVNQQSPAGWTHSNATGNNGGNRAGPGTTNGTWRIGFGEDFGGGGQYALCAAWVGTALSDGQCAELSVNNKTSDWWNCSGGQPTLLVECNTTSLVDIGANASTFSSIGSLTLTGVDPTWTFDGRGAAVAADTPKTFNPIPFMSNQRI